MYKVNFETKELVEIDEVTLKEMNCKERTDLQEWIVSNPKILGEELLIIQKEFSGWDKTNERLDVLALDKKGKLVVIENKTDDSGRDAVWQAIKYASYVSTLTLEQTAELLDSYLKGNNSTEDAKRVIGDFLNKEFDEIKDFNTENSQRIILVARKFRNEVVSAAVWLRKFKIDISCVQITPYKDGDALYLDLDTIYPCRSSEDYTMKMQEKAEAEHQQSEKIKKAEDLRARFWEYFMPGFNLESPLYKSIGYYNKKDHWLAVSAGMRGNVHYAFLACNSYSGVELCIDAGSKALNKAIFDALYNYREEIESKMPDYKIRWERLDDRKQSRISIKNAELSFLDTNSWQDVSGFLTKAMIEFEKVFREYKNVVKEAAGKAIIDANEYDVDTDSPERTDDEDDEITE